MKIALFGAAGGVGRRIGVQAVQAGHTVRGLVRTQEQAEMLRTHGVESILGDLLGDWQQILDEAEAVVWAAGSSAHGDYRAIDQDALMRVTDTLSQRGPRRFIVVSSSGIGREDQMPPFLRDILKAKAVSDGHVQQSGLDWSIVRPGGLTDEPGTGLVQVASVITGGRISRDDVAAVVLACLSLPTTIHQTFEVAAGQQSIAVALEKLTQ